MVKCYIKYMKRCFTVETTPNDFVLLSHCSDMNATVQVINLVLLELCGVGILFF